MIPSQVSYSKEDFLSFILIHASFADLDFSELEIQRIKTKYGTETYDRIKSYYDGLTEYARLEFIMTYKEQFCKTPLETEELLLELEEQFKVDGEYSMLEKDFMNFISHLLQEHWQK